MLEPVSDRFFNTTVVFDPSGKEIARYRKIHLFDVTAPDGTVYNESAVVGSGEELVTFEIDGIVAGLAICYDLRFPELFRALRDQGAEIIFLPANFTLQTGKDHWEPLLRARAIETQCWLLAAATCGQFRNGEGSVRASYGHSLICDPWGHVVARASDGVGTTMGRIDRAVTERVRREIPLVTHRRLPFAEQVAV
jgi:nitrilase